VQQTKGADLYLTEDATPLGPDDLCEVILTDDLTEVIIRL
jgi:hypothetical protein